jgi:hypothetical protein
MQGSRTKPPFSLTIHCRTGKATLDWCPWPKGWQQWLGVLKHLGNRYGRRFANHWEFVHFALDHHLDLDLTSPPQRPNRL